MNANGRKIYIKINSGLKDRFYMLYGVVGVFGTGFVPSEGRLKEGTSWCHCLDHHHLRRYSTIVNARSRHSVELQHKTIAVNRIHRVQRFCAHHSVRALEGGSLAGLLREWRSATEVIDHNGGGISGPWQQRTRDGIPIV